MKIVNIIGKGPSAISGFNNLGPVWGISHAYNYGKLDRVFIIDNFKDFHHVASHPPWNEIHWYDGIKDSEIISKLPLVILENDQGILGGSHHPGETLRHKEKILMSSTVFDIKSSIKLMGTVDFSCSVSYAIAQAIMDGYDMIRLCGVEIWENGGTWKYGYQIQNVGDWLRVAMSRGIQVDIPYQLIPKIMRRPSDYHG